MSIFLTTASAAKDYEKRENPLKTANSIGEDDEV